MTSDADADARSHGITAHDIDLVFEEYIEFQYRQDYGKYAVRIHLGLID